MNRTILALLALGIVAAPLAVSDTAHAQAGGSNATTNETVSQLRERVQTLESENAELKAEVVSKNGRIQKLEFQLQQSKQSNEFTGRDATQLKDIGAWDPHNDRPAFLIWIESEDGGLYQFVGPGNGAHSFNGMRAWSRVLGGDARLLGNVTVELKYAPEGIEETQVYRSTRALSEIRVLVNKMNKPQTRLAWERWNNERRHSAEQQERGTMGVVGAVMLGLFGLGAFIESRKGIVADRSAWKFGRLQSAALDRRRYSRLDDVPVIGGVIRQIREWRRGR